MHVIWRGVCVRGYLCISVCMCVWEKERRSLDLCVCVCVKAAHATTHCNARCNTCCRMHYLCKFLSATEPYSWLICEYRPFMVDVRTQTYGIRHVTWLIYMRHASFVYDLCRSLSANEPFSWLICEYRPTGYRMWHDSLTCDMTQLNVTFAGLFPQMNPVHGWSANCGLQEMPSNGSTL